ncbi:MAG: threonine synthase [Deltaproteobacteria bacterium]|nr:threonine synthase [Deltaproteobacteria bacterium]
MSFTKGLKCRECHTEYPKEPIHVCEYCFGPLEVSYNYDAIRKELTRKVIEGREQNMWRYRELLPIDGEPTVGRQVGFTPLIKAPNLARALKMRAVYIKNDAVNFPTLSFKDRVVSVALSKAKEFNYKTVACASTGNLANSVAANAAAACLASYIFIPHDLEQGKILGTMIYGTHLIGIKGTYDEVNRLCSEIGAKYHWAFVNINIRPYYAEGSKTLAYELMEQLGWKVPDNIVVPMAGGSLITKIWKAIHEFHNLGFTPDTPTRVFGAQASGCAPITTAVKEGATLFKPVRPNTICKSLAIGNPADGFYAMQAMRDSGGWGEDVTDEEIVASMKLLAETEGVFAETAGGVTLGVAQKLIRQGRIKKEESLALCITGNGLKTQEAVAGKIGKPYLIGPTIDEFDRLYKQL